MSIYGASFFCKNASRGVIMEFLSPSQIRTVFERFVQANPHPVSELDAPNSYCFLVSVVLSAQATDKSVNEATKPLYEIVKTPEQMLELGEQKLIEYIRPIGLYKNKSKHILELSRQLIEKFNSEIPSTREELESLSGVGRKTASVILNAVFHQPAMPVDTHLLRICPKIGLAQGKTPVEIEKGLLAVIPKEYLLDAHHHLLLHGRYVCTARNPKCNECIINDICKKNEVSSKELN